LRTCKKRSCIRRSLEHGTGDTVPLFTTLSLGGRAPFVTTSLGGNDAHLSVLTK